MTTQTPQRATRKEPTIRTTQTHHDYGPAFGRLRKAIDNKILLTRSIPRDRALSVLQGAYSEVSQFAEEVRGEDARQRYGLHGRNTLELRGKIQEAERRIRERHY